MTDKTASRPEETASWKKLTKLAELASQTHNRERMGETERFEKYSIRVGSLLVDFSKQRIDPSIFDGLVALAEESQVPDLIYAQMTGEIVNVTEHRPALHTALRTPTDAKLPQLTQDIESEQDRMLQYAEAVRRGERKGFTGRRITHIVHIGIGGSHLGCELACRALNRPGIEIRFLANIDGAATNDALTGLDPETTLFVIVSKTFTTLETLANAHAARTWFLERTCDETAIASHFVAVSNSAAEMTRFGIASACQFKLWEWVGGRFSLWSSVGITIAIAIGAPEFRKFLSGAAIMDQHFREASIAENIPVILALLTIWNSNFLGSQNHAMLSYDKRLKTFVEFVQQLEMESNGKAVHTDGTTCNIHTSPIIWGGEETQGQHAFHQLLHQGTRTFSADFITTVDPEHDHPDHHRWLLANCFSQSQAMLYGTTSQESNSTNVHEAVSGDHSTTTVLIDKLDAAALGSLIALYEHKVTCLGMIWRINSFDQWGVELGKRLAQKIYRALGSSESESAEGPTEGLIRTIRNRTNTNDGDK